MISEEGNFANHIIVVGILDTMLVRDRGARRDRQAGRAALVEITRKTGRARGTGGRWENLRLQVGSPYGGMFALPIELTPDVPGVELLEGVAADTMLAIEGSLQLKQTFDARFATDRLDTRNRSHRGRPTRELQLRVSRVREPNAEERRTGSAVWLEGVVAEPPQVSRHPDLPAIQLAGTILKVAFARPLDFPGVVATIDEIVDVNVAIPTSHRDAEKLFQPGNRVRAIGQLDCRMEYQGGELVRGKLAALDAEWAARKVELAGQPGELRRAEHTYLRTRQGFEAAPRLYVLLGHVELLDGQPIALADTYELRREFVRAQRALRDERRRRVADDQLRRAGDIDPRSGAVAFADVPAIPTTDVAVADMVDLGKRSRPRRHVEGKGIVQMEVAAVPAENSDAVQAQEE